MTMHARAASPDKRMKIYDGMYHEICNEVGRGQVLADMEQWLNARLLQRSTRRVTN